MSQHIGNDHNFLCPNCKKGDELEVIVAVWAQLTPEGTIIDSNDEWDSSSRARCGYDACQWVGTVKDFIELPEGAGPMYVCQDCQTEWPENQLNDAKDLSMRMEPGDIYTDKECPTCGALCYPIQNGGN